MSGVWIVMSSSAKMPASCRHPYRNVALVRVTDEYFKAGRQPAMISKRALGVLDIEHLGHYHVGTTARGAFQRAHAQAAWEAARRNASGDTASSS